MEDILRKNIESRELIIQSLKEEMIGPLDFSKNTIDIIDEHTLEKDIKGKNFAYKNNGRLEEIFIDGQPSKKYATGLLYPSIKETIEDTLEEEIDLNVGDTEEDNDENVSFVSENYANNRQTTMGLTFAVPIEAENLEIEFQCGVYNEYKDFNKNLQSSFKYGSSWWLRKSLNQKINLNLKEEEGYRILKRELLNDKNKIESNYKINVYSNVRNINNDVKIVTITVENVSTTTQVEEGILFQCELKSHIIDSYFSPYPKPSDMQAKVTEEDLKFEMLYSNEKNFAFGHDCSVTWDKNQINHLKEISTTFIPEYEIKSMTPDIKVEGKTIEIKHADIIASKSYEDLHQIFRPLINGYDKWIKEKEKENVKVSYKKIKEKNILELKRALKRMKKGLALLKDELIFDCFKLCNLAMLMQMNNGKKVREITGKSKFSDDMNLNGFDRLNLDSFEKLSVTVEKEIENKNKAFTNCKWRAFQIAFLLQSIEAITNKNSSDREIVDLIWFPTGGGKTEAYLAVSAFSALYRRVKDKNDVGVDTFMRYTLRLLTVDQFQRAARLIISLEYIRRRKVDMLGEKEYSIGLWVGGDTTPNNFEQAKKQFNEIIKNKKKQKFIVTSCPWCGAEIKPIKLEKNTIYQGISIESTLKCSCPDEKCEFENKLPIYFIDEDIYENPPTFLIGTIDKFVQLTWKPKARSLFGINKKGERIVSPPNLIIQDELHLISGPLGSLTGMYETLIEELTYDYRSESKPKILGATATIKAFNTQIKALFGREKSFIFPPSGIFMDDNFFSNVILNEDGTYFPGRKYIGIYPITQGKLQTQVQTFSKLLMTVNNLPIESKNSFWTILSFYNTIKDIGKANSLVDQDIPYTINYNYDKSNIPLDSRRYINREKVKELTSRMNNNEIAGALQELKTDYTITKNEAIDLALASNIIEVGVDIDRLSLMTIVGQPKTTSQYIQVSGRIGRKVDENPGLVIVLYNKGNSTDKSHYEHFNEYHQQLYANVEETSITPFSYFSIERGLPAVLIGFLRQIFDYKKLGIAPNAEFINDNLNKIEDFVEKRIVKKMKLVDTTEKETLQTVYEKVLDNLTGIDYESWESKFNQSGYMVQLNEDTVVQEDQSTIITSMRNVDATSRLKVKNKRKHNYKNFF